MIGQASLVQQYWYLVMHTHHVNIARGLTLEISSKKTCKIDVSFQVAVLTLSYYDFCMNIDSCMHGNVI